MKKNSQKTLNCNFPKDEFVSKFEIPTGRISASPKDSAIIEAVNNIDVSQEMKVLERKEETNL